MRPQAADQRFFESQMKFSAADRPQVLRLKIAKNFATKSRARDFSIEKSRIVHMRPQAAVCKSSICYVLVCGRRPVKRRLCRLICTFRRRRKLAPFRRLTLVRCGRRALFGARRAQNLCSAKLSFAKGALQASPRPKFSPLAKKYILGDFVAKIAAIWPHMYYYARRTLQGLSAPNF